MAGVIQYYRTTSNATNACQQRAGELTCFAAAFFGDAPLAAAAGFLGDVGLAAGAAAGLAGAAALASVLAADWLLLGAAALAVDGPAALGSAKTITRCGKVTYEQGLCAKISGRSKGHECCTITPVSMCQDAQQRYIALTCLASTAKHSLCLQQRQKRVCELHHCAVHKHMQRCATHSGKPVHKLHSKAATSGYQSLI